MLFLKNFERQGIPPAGEANSKNADGYVEDHNKGGVVYTMHFLVYTNYNFKISMFDGVEIFFKILMFIIVEEFSCTVEVHTTT